MPGHPSASVTTRVRAMLASAAQTLQGRGDLAMTAVANVAVTAASAGAGVLAARVLGPDGRGVLAAAIVWSVIVGTISALGLSPALVYASAREPGAIGDIFHTALRIWVVQSLAVVAGGVGIVWLVLTPLQPAAVDATQVFLWSVPAVQLVTYLAAMAQGLGRFTLFNVMRVGPALSHPVVLTVALAAGWRDPARVVWALLTAQIVVAVAALGLFLWHVRPHGAYRSALARQVLRYGLAAYWGGLSWLVNVRLDQFVMSAVVSLGELGTYAVASSYAAVLTPLSSTVAILVFPRVARDDYDRGRRRIQDAWRVTLLVTTAVAAGLAVAAPVLLPWLFGEAFTDAAWPAILLLVAGVFLGGSQVLGSGLRGLGLPTEPSRAEFAGMVMTVLGLFVLLPRAGMVGAAWVSLASYAAVCLILWRVLRRTTTRGPD